MVQSKAMEHTPRAVTWEAPEHNHSEKSGDWFFAFTIIFIAIVISAILLGNTLFALLMAIAGLTLAISVTRRPSLVHYAVSVRGVRVGDDLYPHSNIEAYCIDEDEPSGPQLLIQVKSRLMPLVVIPLPPDYIDDVDDILGARIPEEKLEEPVIMKILELFGF